MVSNVQEVQMTSQGDNVMAYEVSSTFDTCQDIVKKAFLDNDINEKISSANSINIGRLLVDGSKANIFNLLCFVAA